MIDAIAKDAAGNVEFVLHGVDYRIFMGNISVFEQQDVTGIVADFSNEEGQFVPFTRNGAKAVRELLKYAQIKQGNQFFDLNELNQKDTYDREFEKRFSGMETKVSDGSEMGINNVVHLGLLSIVIQNIVLDPDWMQGGPLEVPEGKNSAPRSSDESMANDSGQTLKKTLKQ
ncbi:MAG: hypothetical protein GKR96_04255 [Gammaproteobacteria bacterium]|nr:hypothetical protein [Gammaproteobacteria bacterium]